MPFQDDYHMEHGGAGLLVFVYGTLMKGETNHHLLAGAPFIRSARTRPEYDLFDLGPYPAMVAPGSTAVEGELYAVDDETLARIDRLEGHPDFYQRTAIQLAGPTYAQTYLMAPDQVDGYPRIHSGDWRTRHDASR